MFPADATRPYPAWVPSLRKIQLPRLPDLVEQKLTKTGYTRGASKREIFQNRVTRNNPVLIEQNFWEACRTPDDGSGGYENGSIVLIEPSWYFTNPEPDEALGAQGLELGVNAVLFFRKRGDWNSYAPTSGTLPSGRAFVPATARQDLLGGTYIARIHATVSGPEIVRGYDSTAMRGAGIRVYEYASSATIAAARLQLEAIIWHCVDAHEVMVGAGMTPEGATSRKVLQVAEADTRGLLDYERLQTLRILDSKNRTICPLCMQHVSAVEFFKRGEQAEGREVYDLTVTEVSLFHIQELRVGRLQHKPYNLGWGHHFCNVVVKDAGIIPTLEWMRAVIANQGFESVDPEWVESVEEAVEG